MHELALAEGILKIVTSEPAAEGAELRMETVPAAFTCTDCDWSGPMPRHSACCPNCRSTAVRMIRGREFFVNNLVVE